MHCLFQRNMCDSIHFVAKWRHFLKFRVHSQHSCCRAPQLGKETIAHSQHRMCSLCVASFLICYSDPFLPKDLSLANSVDSWIWGMCSPHFSSASACTWESMCLSIMCSKMDQLILSKWQVCLSRWEGMTFLLCATSSRQTPPQRSILIEG